MYKIRFFLLLVASAIALANCQSPSRAAEVEAKCGYVMLYWKYPQYPAFITPLDDDDNNNPYEEWIDFYKPDMKGNPVPNVFAECYPKTRVQLKEGDKVDASGKVIIDIPRNIKSCKFNIPQPNVPTRFWCE